MNKFLGDNEQFFRFTLLTCGLLTLAGACVSLCWSNALYAIACSIVSAWSIGYYIDTLLEKLVMHKHDDQTESQETTQE